MCPGRCFGEPSNSPHPQSLGQPLWRRVVSDRTRLHESLNAIASGLETGIILRDSNGQIVWVDQALRARLNGGLNELVSSVSDTSADESLPCTLSTAPVALDGTIERVCIIQEGAEDKERGFDAMAAIEAAVSDTASWFTRAVMERLKARHQTTQHTPRTSDLDMLSDREREVLGLICEGRSDAQMSNMLGLSQNTVRNHIAALYRKIGVNRRTAAIIWARERGITAQDALGARRRSRPRPNHAQR